ncbi:IS110 family transposase [Thalassococcus profundi]|uniref:IS110 family transposase n=1 Tax=Thalassococcus profundi TaxID=2282382 RepID=UPI004059C342
MFAGIDVASERHVLARLDGTGQPLGRPIGIDEDAGGYRMLLEALGPPPALVVMEATGHYWKNLFASLVAAGHDVVLLNPIVARRFQQAQLERTKTDAIDAAALARFAFEKRPTPSYIHDDAAESLRELVRHRDRLQQDFEDRVLQLHRLVDLGFPEFTRYVKGMHTMLATALLAECPTAAAFARTPPRRLAKLRYDGRHRVGEDLAGRLVEAARRSVGQHHGPVYDLQVRHICQDLDLWRRRLKELESDIGGLLDAHEVGRLLTSIDGIGPNSAARIIAIVGDPARFRSAGAFAAYVGVVPALRQSGKRTGTRAATGFGNARLRSALWMTTLAAVRLNDWLRPFYERLRAAGKPPKLALIAAMRKLLHAVYSVAKNRKPFVPITEQARAA